MRFELFIALRYLFSRRGGQKFISITSVISVLGVGLGVGALIVVMGVMNGFTVDLRDKIIGVSAHAILSDGTGHTKDSPELYQQIREVRGVTGVTPFVYSELMLSTQSGVKGIALRGIDPATAHQVLGVLRNIPQEDIDELNSPDGLPGIIVGRALANRLNLVKGSRVNMLSPSGQHSSAGFNPKIKAFRVTGIFSIGLFEYDSTMAFVSLAAGQDVLGLPPDIITGVEVAVDDVYEARSIMDTVLEKVGPHQYYAQTWMEMNSNLFAALKLEKAAMAVILTLIILVGSFSIITALVMLVMEKTRDIAILMSMGATPKAIRKIFIYQGMVIGVIGTTLGFVLGLGISSILTHYRFIELPQGIYSLDYLPVLLEWTDLAATGVCALLLCFLATLYPSYQAATLNPVAALRAE